MKVTKPYVDIIPQEPGIIGMFKHIERCGRISYKSESRITDTSYEAFIKMLYNRGHWAVFNLGTVYLTIPKKDYEKKSIKISVDSVLGALYTRYTVDNVNYYITTNYRVICQCGLEDIMKKYWTEPSENHYHRVTSHWVCSRFTSHQIIRHRSMSFIQESQRYVNYEKKDGIEYILPQWVYDIRTQIGGTINPITRRPRFHILNLDGEKLWNELVVESDAVKARNNTWQVAENEYNLQIERNSLKPEDARGCLLNDTKTELCMCGYVEDYMMSPGPETKEKVGFFYLRCAPDAQRDVRVLAQSLKDQFIEKGIDKLK